LHLSPWRLPRSPARLPHRRLAVVEVVAGVVLAEGVAAVEEAAIPAVAGVAVAIQVVVAAMAVAVTVVVGTVLAAAGVATAAA
jgi:hypothetical protein